MAVRRIWRGFNGARPAPGVATRRAAVARASRPSSGTWRWGASCARRVHGHPGGVAVPCGAARRVAHVHVRGRVEEQRTRTVAGDGGAAHAAACMSGRAAGCCGGECRGGPCGGRSTCVRLRVRQRSCSGRGAGMADARLGWSTTQGESGQGPGMRVWRRLVATEQRRGAACACARAWAAGAARVLGR